MWVIKIRYNAIECVYRQNVPPPVVEANFGHLEPVLVGLVCVLQNETRASPCVGVSKQQLFNIELPKCSRTVAHVVRSAVSALRITLLRQSKSDGCCPNGLEGMSILRNGESCEESVLTSLSDSI
jgi:hypothetical protein